MTDLGLSCDILGISLIYVSPTSEYGGGKLIKQFSQPANTSFFHLGTHLFPDFVNAYPKIHQQTMERYVDAVS